MNTEDSKAFERNSKIKEGSRGWYENCVDDKRKNEIELILGGHHVIRSEYKAFNSIWKQIKSKKRLRKIIWKLCKSQKQKWNRTKTWWSLSDKKWKWKTQKDLKDWNHFQSKKAIMKDASFQIIFY